MFTDILVLLYLKRYRSVFYNSTPFFTYDTILFDKHPYNMAFVNVIRNRGEHNDCFSLVGQPAHEMNGLRNKVSINWVSFGERPCAWFSPRFSYLWTNGAE